MHVRVFVANIFGNQLRLITSIAGVLSIQAISLKFISVELSLSYNGINKVLNIAFNISDLNIKVFLKNQPIFYI